MILETANDGFWEIDPHAVGVNVNAELCAMLHHTRTEIIGHLLYEFTDAAHQAIFKEQLAKRHHGERSQYENILLRPDGTAVHCQFNSSPLYDEAGRFTGSFAMVTDISQRKHAENTFKNREAMLRAIFESTDSGIAVIDETGRISQIKNRFHHLFLPTEDLPSRNHAATLKERLSPHLTHSAIPEEIHKPSILSSSEKSWRVTAVDNGKREGVFGR
ncbi:MAG: PAS domain S-box protein [Deltaproteobacteria bacterium]|nr:PAS domain S-box protein [Deltaproteobacteria bacterium]